MSVLLRRVWMMISARPQVWLTMVIIFNTIVAVTGIIIGTGFNLTGLLLVGPLLACARCDGRATAVVGAYSVGLCIVVGQVTGQSGATMQRERVVVVLMAGALAVLVAEIRGRRESRLIRIAERVQRAILRPLPAELGGIGFASHYQSATPGAPAPWSEWKFWQSGGTSNHDDDVFNGTAAELSAWISSFSPHAEDEVQSGQLNNGANAVTVITVPWGSGANIAFGCDNGVQGLAPAVLRVAIWDTQWHVTDTVTVDGTKGQTVLQFPDGKKTGVISVVRQDAGEVIVGYEVS